ncbi:MAG: Crp/Fnr family transcriptional regulator [Bacteroidota bacterium]
MHKNIIQHLKKFIDLSESEVDIVKKYIETIQLKKREFVLQESKVCRKLFFVEKGCLRMFFINKKGSEQITQFALESWWISDYQSFMNNTVSDYYIQSIEASTIVSIDSENLDSLLIELPQLEKYFRRMMQKTIAQTQLRSKLMYEMTKEEFYFHFSTSFPEFMMRVPQYMIASYLGLSPEYMSELRKKTI